MTGKTGSNYPGGRKPSDQVRPLQRRLWVAAKRSPERRFHALMDRIWRGDVLQEAWRRVRSNRGSAGVEGETLAEIEQYGVERRLDPVLRGWGQYFRTGNASRQFLQLDRYVVERLRGLLFKRHGSRLPPGRADGWREDFFVGLGLHRLRGTIQYPGVASCGVSNDRR